MKKKKVLIVDDSAIMRKFLTDIISSSKDVEVIATAMDPLFAAQKIKSHNPDIIVLDTDMPRMDGITFLREIMSTNPLPVIMVSDETPDSAKKTIISLELGAIDFIIKPTFSEISEKEKLLDFSNKLINRVIEAGKSNIKTHDTPVEMFQKVQTDRKKIISNQVIVIGASAGGVQVIYDIIYNMPPNIPGILIAQHMPKDFTKAFADSLNDKSKLYVKELDQTERIYKGNVYVAPGSKHIVLKKDHMGYFAALDDSEPVNRHKPSVDVLFHSAAEVAGENAVGIILTGMGEDGARGLLDMKESGAFTIAQDRESSTVFGMPAQAIKMGAATEVKNIVEIINYLSAIVFNED